MKTYLYVLLFIPEVNIQTNVTIPSYSYSYLLKLSKKEHSVFLPFVFVVTNKRVVVYVLEAE